jgi:hypothetical protein
MKNRLRSTQIVVQRFSLTMTTDDLFSAKAAAKAANFLRPLPGLGATWF